MIQILNLEELCIKFPHKRCMSHLFLPFVYDLRDNCILTLGIFYQNLTHQSLAINNSCDRQSNTFDRSVIRAPNAPLLSTLFFHFSNTAIKQCWALNPLQKPHWYRDRIFQKLDCIWSYKYLSYKYLLYTLKTFDKMLIGL